MDNVKTRDAWFNHGGIVHWPIGVMLDVYLNMDTIKMCFLKRLNYVLKNC